MSAHYLIRLEEVRDGVLAELQDELGLVDDVLVPHSAECHGIAQHIDPYGTTSFNGIQAEALLTEIASISSDKLNPRQTEVLGDLVALLQRATSEVHLRVSFLGD